MGNYKPRQSYRSVEQIGFSYVIPSTSYPRPLTSNAAATTTGISMHKENGTDYTVSATYYAIMTGCLVELGTANRTMTIYSSDTADSTNDAEINIMIDIPSAAAAKTNYVYYSFPIHVPISAGRFINTKTSGTTNSPRIVQLHIFEMEENLTL